MASARRWWRPSFGRVDLIGWVSVHNTRGPHQWTKSEIAAIEAACAKVASQIDALG